MSDPVQIALITAVLQLLLMGMQVWQGKKVSKVADDVAKVEKSTNSMKDALVAVTRSDALREGHAEGVIAEKARQSDAKGPTS